jgi:4-aminobutyrate aminotransferase-like enzyme
VAAGPGGPHILNGGSSTCGHAWRSTPWLARSWSRFDRFAQVGDVRPLGAWVTVEFVTDKESIRPAPAFQTAVHQAVLRRGMLAISEDNKPLYRMQPALTMPPDLFRWSCRQLADAIEEVAAAPPQV